MTKQKLLTDPAVRAKDKPPGYYLDGHGLYLQVSASGSRSWIFRYTLNKKTREMGMGSLDDFSLAEARERTRRYRQILADGHDPIEYRREEKAKLQASQLEANRRSITFSDCAKEYHETNKDDWKNAKHAAQWINTLSTYAFPKFGDLPVGEVTREHTPCFLRLMSANALGFTSAVMLRIAAMTCTPQALSSGDCCTNGCTGSVR